MDRAVGICHLECIDRVHDVGDQGASQVVGGERCSNRRASIAAELYLRGARIAISRGIPFEEELGREGHVRPATSPMDFDSNRVGANVQHTGWDLHPLEIAVAWRIIKSIDLIVGRKIPINGRCARIISHVLFGKSDVIAIGIHNRGILSLDGKPQILRASKLWRGKAETLPEIGRSAGRTKVGCPSEAVSGAIPRCRTEGASPAGP